MEEEDMDKDVFLNETLYEEESQVLRDMEEQQALSSRLFKWKRPALSQPYQFQSQSIVFQQLEIDYVIGERVIRNCCLICLVLLLVSGSLGLLGKDIAYAAMFMDLNHISTSAVLQEWDLMISFIFIKFLRGG